MTRSFDLLRALCAVHAPSGDETAMKDFLLEHIQKEKKSWQHQPEIFHGEDFQDCIVLVFGKPRTAIYAHIDSIGFTVRYNRQLVKIGSPHLRSGMQLKGRDGNGDVVCSVSIDEEQNLTYDADREIERGTNLTFLPVWREDQHFVQCCYMDNRLGVWQALEICKSLEHGAIVFSCWEEHGGGSVPFLARFLFENYNIRKSLISDITWVTEGVSHGNGTVISVRDTGLPRRSFVNHIIGLAKESGIPFQLEIESAGGSDGTELQKQPYPIDWCFIGPPEDHVHTPDEKVHKSDIESTVLLYNYLMKHL